MAAQHSPAARGTHLHSLAPPARAGVRQVQVPRRAATVLCIKADVVF
jgi:hypothetical protein